MRLFSIFCATALLVINGTAWADPVAVTLLHTNDLHSHFRPELDVLGLGGIARIKTAVDRVRSATPNTLLLDGGDWSEGNIYYNLGAGVETLRMMDHVGYDVVVVGNHDWLNGPDVLLNALQTAKPSFQIVAANIAVDKYPRAAEFQKLVTPYVIRKVGGVKIAFIGLVTYEFIYDSFFEPVKIQSPLALIKKLAATLKPQVDAIVVISHNQISLNQQLLGTCPDVDLVIGAHDHVQLNKPVFQVRPGHKNPSFIVETGAYGKYLGRVDLKITPRAEATAAGVDTVDLVNYSLTQMDSRIPENPDTLDRLDDLEDSLEEHYGPIFHDHVADSEVEATRSGVESLMGDLVTDAYKGATGADIALDQNNFIYGEFHRGPLRTVDVYNAIPAIHSPVTDKSWTLHTVPLTGKTIKWLLDLLLQFQGQMHSNLVDAAGLQIVYLTNSANSANPANSSSPTSFMMGLGSSSSSSIASSLAAILVNGQPLDEARTYSTAIGGGILEAFKFVNSYFPNTIPMDQVVDTGVEDWRVVLNYIHAMTTLTRDKIQFGDRVQSQSADLGVMSDDITLDPIEQTSKGLHATAHVRITNYGQQSVVVNGQSVRLMLNQNGVDYSNDAILIELAGPQKVKALGARESQDFTWDVVIPADNGIYAVTAKIDGADAEANTSNNEVTRFFDADSL